MYKMEKLTPTLQGCCEDEIGMHIKHLIRYSAPDTSDDYSVMEMTMTVIMDLQMHKGVFLAPEGVAHIFFGI